MTPPKPATSDPAPCVVDTGRGRLAYADEGPQKAPALVALHGIPGSLRDFRYLAPLLRERVRFVRLDLPGFGGSPAEAAAIDTLDGRAQAVLALADHLGLARFAVLGHSMGGATALVLAAEHAPRVETLVLVASVALSLHRGLGLTPRAYGRLAAWSALPLLGRVLLPLARRAYRRRRFPGADTMDLATVRLQLRAAAATDFPRLRRAVAGPLPPTLLAYAQDDHMVETAVAEELARALPSARVLAFAEGGHNLQKTRAAELAAAIVELLRR